MRLLANENFPLASVRTLRAAGHDVTAIIENTPGTTDTEVLAQAAREARIILTLLNTEAVTLEGKFTVVERARLRQRPLPS